MDSEFGAVTWDSEIAISKEDLARAVTFAAGSVRVRTGDVPALNSKARVELFNIDKTEASLRKKTLKMGARFVSYERGTWTFDVDRFGASA